MSYNRNLQINSRIFLFGTDEPNFQLDRQLLKVENTYTTAETFFLNPSITGLKDALNTTLNIYNYTKTYETEKHKMTIMEHVARILP